MNLLRMQPRIGVDALETIASGVDHAEGICLTPDGTLYVSGEAGQIDRVNGDGTVTEVATTGGWTLGLAADANGRIYACDPVRRAVLRWTPSTNEVKVVSTGNQDDPVSTPNWGAFGPDGSYSVSDSEPGSSGMAGYTSCAAEDLAGDGGYGRLSQWARGVTRWA
jgi:sugar lactone lactonase YvrE